MRFQPGYLALILAANTNSSTAATVVQNTPNQYIGGIKEHYPCGVPCVVGIPCPCTMATTMMAQQPMIASFMQPPTMMMTAAAPPPPIMMVQQSAPPQMIFAQSQVPQTIIATQQPVDRPPCVEKESIEKMLDILIKIEKHLIVDKPPAPVAETIKPHVEELSVIAKSQPNIPPMDSIVRFMSKVKSNYDGIMQSDRSNIAKQFKNLNSMLQAALEKLANKDVRVVDAVKRSTRSISTNTDGSRTITKSVDGKATTSIDKNVLRNRGSVLQSDENQQLTGSRGSDTTSTSSMDPADLNKRTDAIQTIEGLVNMELIGGTTSDGVDSTTIRGPITESRMIRLNGITAGDEQIMTDLKKIEDEINGAQSDDLLHKLRNRIKLLALKRGTSNTVREEGIRLMKLSGSKMKSLWVAKKAHAYELDDGILSKLFGDNDLDAEDSPMGYVNGINVDGKSVVEKKKEEVDQGLEESSRSSSDDSIASVVDEVALNEGGEQQEVQKFENQINESTKWEDLQKLLLEVRDSDLKPASVKELEDKIGQKIIDLNLYNKMKAQSSSIQNRPHYLTLAEIQSTLDKIDISGLESKSITDLEQLQNDLRESVPDGDAYNDVRVRTEKMRQSITDALTARRQLVSEASTRNDEIKSSIEEPRYMDADEIASLRDRSEAFARKNYDDLIDRAEKSTSVSEIEKMMSSELFVIGNDDDPNVATMRHEAKTKLDAIYGQLMGENRERFEGIKRLIGKSKTVDELKQLLTRLDQIDLGSNSQQEIDSIRNKIVDKMNLLTRRSGIKRTESLSSSRGSSPVVKAKRLRSAAASVTQREGVSKIEDMLRDRISGSQQEGKVIEKILLNELDNIKQRIGESKTDAELNSLLTRLDQMNFGLIGADKVNEARNAIQERRSEISARNLRSPSPVSDDTEVVPPAQRLGRIVNRIVDVETEKEAYKLIDELNQMNKSPNQVPSELQERWETALSLLETKIGEIKGPNLKETKQESDEIKSSIEQARDLTPKEVNSRLDKIDISHLESKTMTELLGLLSDLRETRVPDGEEFNGVRQRIEEMRQLISDEMNPRVRQPGYMN